MSSGTWTSLVAGARAELVCAGRLPRDLARDPAIGALARIVALARTHITTQSIDDSVDPDVIVRPAVSRDTTMAELLGEIRATIGGPIRGRYNQARGLGLEAFALRYGLTDLVGTLARESDRRPAIDDMIRIVADAAQRITARITELTRDHAAAVVRRDTAALAKSRQNAYSPVIRWALAPELSGSPTRPEIVRRREQALVLFGSVKRALFEAPLTALIDRGEPLLPGLAAHLDLPPAAVRALRGAVMIEDAVDTYDDLQAAVRELRDHQVPLHEWPGGGRSDQAAAWKSSPWGKSHDPGLIRADFLGEGSAVKDAIGALRDDLLRPLVADRLRHSAAKPSNLAVRFTYDLNIWGNGDNDLGNAVRRSFLRALHRAIIGARRPKAFQEAVTIWHRRAASLAALRHEGRLDRPGWPPLCAPWISSCGRYQVVALASAHELVEEGNTHQHCVGGYYNTSRQGDTQILSLRRDGRPMATVEVLLGPDLEQPTLRVGQFEGFHRCRPTEDLHRALRAFLRAVRSGAHPLNLGDLARYRKRMRRNEDGWRSDALPLAHTREAFPLYLPLLPRGTPHDFDAWLAAGGLGDAVDAVFGEFARREAVRTAALLSGRTAVTQ